MKQVKTEAIILDTTDVFDADRLFLLFTRELGKLRARAKGVRKPTSRLTGHLLEYLPTQLELIESSGGFFLVVQAQVIGVSSQAGTYPADAIAFSRQAALLSEAINRLFTDLEPHPEVYDGLAYTLDRLRALCESKETTTLAKLVAAEFLLKALVELGYRPELRACLVTEQPIQEEFVAWNSQLGGVLSKEGYEQSGRQGRIVAQPRAIVVLRQLAEPRFVAERLNVGADVEEEACQLIYDYLQTQIGQPLRSLVGG
ncbi:MAG: DNA repair protein RecO [bacterium]